MKRNSIYIILCLSVLTLSCQNTQKKQNKNSSEATEEVAEEWKSLSNSNSLEGWHIYQNEAGEKTGWSVEEGVFTYNSETAEGKGNKSLISNEKYKNFEIQFEWKLSPNSNSGFMWGVSEDLQYDHPYLTGPEIQIIDAEIYGG